MRNLGGTDFELHITDVDATSGSIPVTWCLSKDLFNRISSGELTSYASHTHSSHLKDYIVCISVSPVNQPYKQDVFIADLNDLMTYITFKYPGENKISAQIYPKAYTQSFKRLEDRRRVTFEQKYYDNEVGDYFDEKLESQMLQAKQIVVNVPVEMFAKEPSAWEKTWISWGLDVRAIDQCSFRKKRMFAYTVQPIIFLLNVLVRMIALIFSVIVLGKNPINKIKFLNPLTSELFPGEPIDSGCLFEIILLEDSVYLLNSKKGVLKYSLVIAALIGGLAYFITAFHLWLPFVSVLLLVSIAAIIVWSIAAFRKFNVFDKLLDCIFKLFNKNLETLPAETEFLICSGEPRAVGIKTLPRKKVSIKLRYLDLKSKICKPFAG